MDEQFDWLAWWRQHWFSALLVAMAAGFHVSLLAMPLPPEPEIVEPEQEEEIVEITSLVAPSPMPSPPPAPEAPPSPTASPNPAAAPQLTAAPALPPVTPSTLPRIDTSRPSSPAPLTAASSSASPAAAPAESGSGVSSAPSAPLPPLDPTGAGNNLVDVLFQRAHDYVLSQGSATESPAEVEAAMRSTPTDELGSAIDPFLDGQQFKPGVFNQLNLFRIPKSSAKFDFIEPLLQELGFIVEDAGSYGGAELLRVKKSLAEGELKFYISLVVSDNVTRRTSTFLVLWDRNPNGGE